MLTFFVKDLCLQNIELLSNKTISHSEVKTQEHRTYNLTSNIPCEGNQ